jgi:hypothetical protein
MLFEEFSFFKYACSWNIPHSFGNAIWKFFVLLWVLTLNTTVYSFYYEDKGASLLNDVERHVIRKFIDCNFSLHLVFIRKWEIEMYLTDHFAIWLPVQSMLYPLHYILFQHPVAFDCSLNVFHHLTDTKFDIFCGCAILSHSVLIFINFTGQAVV